mgnify:CR=1 FL=1
MSSRRNTTPPSLRPPLKSWGWHLGGLLDKLTLSTGAPDEQARAGEKRDRVDYDALAEQLVAEADRLLALILNEEDEGGGVTLTPPESQAEAALLSPGRRQAELHALLRRADETLGADAEPDAAASPLRMPEAPPATAAPLAPPQWASEGSRGPRAVCRRRRRSWHAPRSRRCAAVG